MSIKAINNFDEDVCEITLSTDVILLLKFEDDSIGIYAKKEKVEEIAFRVIEEDHFMVAKLTHAFLEGHGGIYQRHGVATQAVRYFLECTNYSLELPENDGLRQSDGSHLTSDGVRFITSLRVKLGNVKL